MSYRDRPWYQEALEDKPHEKRMSGEDVPYYKKHGYYSGKPQKYLEYNGNNKGQRRVSCSKINRFLAVLLGILIGSAGMYIAILQYPALIPLETSVNIPQSVIGMQNQNFINSTMPVTTNPLENSEIKRDNRGYDIIGEFSANGYIPIMVHNVGSSRGSSENSEGKVYSTWVWLSFDTDFLVAEGLDYGDTCRVSISVNYLDNNEIAQDSAQHSQDVIIGDLAEFTFDVYDPTGWLTINDILDFTVDWDN